MPVKKKEDALLDQQDVITETTDDLSAITFNERYHLFCAYVREKAPSVLKFDSNVSNIDYDYVDTQQYKSFIGACADACDISFAWGTGNPELRIEKNDKDRQIFIVTVTCQAVFMDAFSDKAIELDACGMGVSIGNNYALSIAQTNAMRNFIINNFLLPTNDRDTDDMKFTVDAGKFLTDDKKAEKRSELLESTKSASEYATLAYAKVVAKRIEDTLSKDIPDDFRKRLETFLSSKFDEVDGARVPKCPDGMTDVWVVKKKAANAIMSDLDEYNG